VVRHCLLAWVVFWCACMGKAQAQILELNTALARVAVGGQTTERPVVLPYHWDEIHPGQAGRAVFEVAFAMTSRPTEPYGLYVARLGNAYEIWLNGALLAHQGEIDLPNSADFAKAPRYILVAPDLLAARNRIEVKIRADVARRGGLAPLVLGPDAQVYPRYLADYHLRVTGSLVVLVLGILVGTICLALWLTQIKVQPGGRRTRDSVYGLASLAEFAWTISVGDALIENPLIAWPWWGSVPLATTSIWTCSILLLCADVAGWRQKRPMRWLMAWLVFLIVACQAAAVLSRFAGQPLALKYMYLLCGLSVLAFTAYFIARAFRGAGLEHRLLALALAINTLMGLRDIYVFEVQQVFGQSSLLRYSAILFGLTLGLVVMLRLRQVSFEAHALSKELKLRVLQKERELAQNYAQAEHLAREQARLSERGRILQDVHDGLGAHLSSAIRQSEGGAAGKEELLATLYATLDELKLSVDTVSMQAGDVNALLASLRYRLEPRLQGAGLQFQWEVAQLPHVPGLDAMAMRQLQFMLLEAVSNALQHAQANVLRLQAMASSHSLSLRIIDDGHGFDTATVGRKGLPGLRGRASALGARCTISSGPQGTCVHIELALDAIPARSDSLLAAPAGARSEARP
jgi:signal transduction histidine kinase